MHGFWTILLLIVSNIFMTFAWYGHLKLQEMKISTSWPLILVILFSWGLAFFEYCAQVPANSLGASINGGPFSLVQLKVIQEVISLMVFTLVVSLLFKGESLHWNHLAAFVRLVMAVFFVFPQYTSGLPGAVHERKATLALQRVCSLERAIKRHSSLFCLLRPNDTSSPRLTSCLKFRSSLMGESVSIRSSGRRSNISST